MPSLSPLRVLLIAASPLARAGLAVLLQEQPRLDIVGQVDIEDYASAVDIYRPHVIVWDFGYDAASLHDALTDTPSPVVPVIGMSANETDAAAWLPSLYELGLRGLLPHNVSGDSLAAAIVLAEGGLMVTGAAASEMLLSRSVSMNPQSSADLLDSFTPRERDVLALVAEGMPNKTIARQLSISEHTVKFHLNAILTKLNARSRTEAVVRATRLGLIAL